MMPTPCSRRRRITPKSALGVVLGERGGRLVQDQDPRPGSEGPRDLDELLLGHAEPARLPIRVDPRPHLRQQVGGPAAPLPPVHGAATAPPGSRPMAMFSATVRSGKSAGCW